MARLKILAWGDYCCYTGFAGVMSNILRRLTDIADIDVVGVNYDGRPDYDHDRFPGRVWPAQSFLRGPHPYEDQYGMQSVLDLLRENDYDVLFMLQDTFIAMKIMDLILKLRERYDKKFKIVYYYPMDCEPLAKWVDGSVAVADFPVAYSQFGYNCSVSVNSELEDKIKIIPHGIDLNDFYAMADIEELHEFKERLTYGQASKFLLFNNNRNTQRKDIPRSLMVLKILKDMDSDVAMYLHMSPQDLGGDFTIVASDLGLEYNVDYFFPTDLGSLGYPISMMNKIYNVSDAVITTSLGEGWGFSLTEAMAVGVPVFAPDHSAISEILADGRGFLIKAGNISSLWHVVDSDNMVLRPLVDVDDMAETIREYMDDPELRENTTGEAHEWVKELNWDKIVKEYWIPLIEESVMSAA